MGVCEINGGHWYDWPFPTGKHWPWKSVGKAPSVTTTMDAVMAAPHLYPWYAKQAAGHMAGNLERMAGLIACGKTDEAVALAAAEPTRIRDRAGALGTLVHYVLENLVKGQVYTLTPGEEALVAPYIELLKRIVEETGLWYRVAEATVYNMWQNYAGTMDALGTLGIPVPILSRGGERLGYVEPGESGIFDYKTGTGSSIPTRGPMQVVGYGACTHMDLKDESGRLDRMPEVTWGALFHLTPPTYKIHAVRVTPVAKERFYAACRWHEAMRNPGEEVMGIPLRGPGIHVDDLTFIKEPARNKLVAEHRVTSLEELAAFGRLEFLALDQVGKKTLVKMDRFMAAAGLQWRTRETQEEGVA